ncbi:MAG: TraM recognition domain-containing protein, partial [Thermoplasmatota archaeon]
VYTDMLSEGRKYGLRLVLANQYTSQLDQKVWNAIEGNVGTTISFASSTKDAELLSKNFGDKVEQHEFVNLEPFNALVNYGGSEVNRVKTMPPSPVITEDALERTLEKMESLSPNLEMKLQRANTPRWENERADRWDILIGIYRKQLREQIPPLVSDVKKEEPRNNLSERLRKMDANGIVDYNPTNDDYETVSLNEDSIDEIFELIGSSNKAGKREHKEMILKVWETLETNDIRTHIIRQDQRGSLPDLTIEYCPDDELKWGGADIEVEKSTRTKPAKILKNLASAQNKGRKLLLFTDDLDGAERIYDIIRYPYTSSGQCYKDTKGRKFKPKEEFANNYWSSRDNNSDLNDLYEIYVLEDGIIKRFEPGRNLKVILTHRKKREGGDYQLKTLKTKIQDHLPMEEKEKTSVNENVGSENDDEWVGTIKDENGNRVPWLVEEGGSIKLSNPLKERIDDRKKKINSDTDDISQIEQMVQKELNCGKLDSVMKQPNEMELQLEDIPHPQRYLLLTVEAMYAYSKYQKHGYHIPQKPVSIKILMDCLEEKGKAKLPKRDQSFGKKYSDFLKSLGVDAEFKEKRNRNFYDLHPQSELFKKMYKFKIVKTIGEGHYTYPMFYELSQGSLGRHTACKLFDNFTIKFNGLTIDVFKLEFDLECQILKEIVKVPKDELSIERLKDGLDIEKDEIESTYKNWGLNPEKKDEFRNISRNISRILEPFIE